MDWCPFPHFCIVAKLLLEWKLTLEGVTQLYTKKNPNGFHTKYKIMFICDSVVLTWISTMNISADGDINLTDVTFWCRMTRNKGSVTSMAMKECLIIHKDVIWGKLKGRHREHVNGTLFVVLIEWCSS